MTYQQHYNRVIERHGAQCHYCGTSPGRYSLTLDHVKPKSKGGSHHPRNLRPCCGRCNSVKGTKRLDDARAALLRAQGLLDDGKLYFERKRDELLQRGYARQMGTSELCR